MTWFNHTWPFQLALRISCVMDSYITPRILYTEVLTIVTQSTRARLDGMFMGQLISVIHTLSGPKMQAIIVSNYQNGRTLL